MAIEVVVAPNATEAAAAYEARRSVAEVLPGFRELTGIGDRAFTHDGVWVAIQGRALADLLVLVVARPGEPEPPEAPGLQLLEAAASRLPT